MTGRLEGWKVGRWIILGMLLSNIPTFQLAAQVGHDPGSSPYHDILLHSGPVFFVGHLGADRGAVGAGTSNALTFGARYEIPAGRSLHFQFTGALLHGDRFIIDPKADSSSPARRTGPFKSDLALVEIGMQLRLSGGKTWRGFAPYVGTGLGLMIDVNSPGDTTGSGYRFGTKLTLKVAVVATAISCTIGLPLGYFLATRAFWGRRAALTVVNTALAFPTVVVGLLLYGLLSRRGPLGELGWLYTWQAIVVGDVLLALPIAAALSAAAVQGVDPRVRRTAETLGAGPWRAAWTVAREARFALAAVITAAFGQVVAEIGAAMILGGNIRGSTRTLTTAVALYTAQGDFGLAVALGLVLIAIALLVNVTLQALQGKGGG